MTLLGAADGRDLPALLTPAKILDFPIPVFALLLTFLHLAWKLTWGQSARQAGHEQALKMAADPVSSLFPNRPIRPLPKRRLRERLSPEVADSIQYPPLPRTVAPLFPYPYSLPEETTVDTSYPPVREDAPYPEQRQRHTSGSGIGHDGNFSPRQGAASRAIGHSSVAARAKLGHGRYADSFPPQSATSSADGYDPFENTNNKKRKIPTAGDSVPSGVHPVNDSAAGPSSAASTNHIGDGPGESAGSSTPYYGSGSLASGMHNIPGPGRGRYGRPRNFKNVARPLFDSTNSWAGRSARPRTGQWTTSKSSISQ